MAMLDFETAIELYSTKIDKDPKNTKLLFKRASLYRLKDEFDDAIMDYSRIIAEKPRNISMCLPPTDSSKLSHINIYIYIHMQSPSPLSLSLCKIPVNVLKKYIYPKDSCTLLLEQHKKPISLYPFPFQSCLLCSNPHPRACHFA